MKALLWRLLYELLTGLAELVAVETERSPELVLGRAALPRPAAAPPRRTQEDELEALARADWHFGLALGTVSRSHGRGPPKGVQ